jgi:O-methyltransferase involved in polyketide biosynthesis
MSHESISPTAWLVAYQRSLSDISLASEVFIELEKIIKQTRTTSEIESMEALKLPKMAVMWEARFKIINHVLKAYPVDQFLEIAAGFSTRGLNLANDARMTYVEVDLPGVIQEKQTIVESLIVLGKIPLQPNFHLAEGNALNLADLLSATRFFTDKPIAIINEGLLSYLNRAELTTFANNVHTVLKRFGGIWITPDIALQLPEAILGQEHGVGKVQTEKIEDLTGIDVLNNRFKSEEDARTFFEQFDFHVERHSFMEVADQLALPPKGSLAQKAIEQGVLFVMTVTGR